MVKKKFTECKMEILLFDSQDVIRTSGEGNGFEGVIDVFYDENGNATD